MRLEKPTKVLMLWLAWGELKMMILLSFYPPDSIRGVFVMDNSTESSTRLVWPFNATLFTQKKKKKRTNKQTNKGSNNFVSNA